MVDKYNQEVYLAALFGSSKNKHFLKIHSEFTA